MQIVAIDGDELADGSGYAPLTFIGMELLNTNYNANLKRSGSSGAYTEGTGSIGGWDKSVLKQYILENVAPKFPETVSRRVQTVTKYTRIYNTAGSVVNNVATSERFWSPSFRETAVNPNKMETKGPMYSLIFTDNTSRIRNKIGSSNGSTWWLRSAYDSSNWGNIFPSGSSGYNSPDSKYSICLGFCLGLEQETIEDSWETILANENYATDYSIGDTKYIDLGTEGKHLMQIVAFDSDEKTSGGKAKITWLEKDLFTAHYMNITSTNAGGWPATKMRDWLRNTVLPTIPSEVRSHIVEVNKTYYDYNSGSGVTNTQADTIWLPSCKEMFGNIENSGVDYTTLFNNDSARIKKSYGKIASYWLRSAYSTNTNRFRAVDSRGTLSYSSAVDKLGVCIGFCTD